MQVNPYKQLPNTGPEFVQMYQFSTASGGDAPPHIYKVYNSHFSYLLQPNFLFSPFQIPNLECLVLYAVPVRVLSLYIDVNHVNNLLPTTNNYLEFITRVYLFYS